MPSETAQCTVASKEASKEAKAEGWGALSGHGEEGTGIEDTHGIGVRPTRMSLSTCHSSSTERDGSPPHGIGHSVSCQGGTSQQEGGGGQDAPFGSLHSMRLLNEVQEVPGPHGAYARHLISFLRRRWWAQVRSRMPGPLLLEEEGGDPRGFHAVPVACGMASSRCPSVMCCSRGDSGAPGEKAGLFPDVQSPFDMLADPPSVLHPFAAAAPSEGFRPGDTGLCEVLSPRPTYSWRSASCHGRLQRNEAATETAAAETAAGWGFSGGGKPRFMGFPKEVLPHDLPLRGAGKKQQQHERRERYHGKKSEALLKNKLWTLGSVPDHAMVVTKPSKVGRLSSCIFPSGPSVRGAHRGRSTQTHEPSGIKLLPVLSPRKREGERQLPAHFGHVDADEGKASFRMGFKECFGKRESKERTFKFPQCHLRQPHHQCPPRQELLTSEQQLSRAPPAAVAAEPSKGNGKSLSSAALQQTAAEKQLSASAAATRCTEPQSSNRARIAGEGVETAEAGSSALAAHLAFQGDTAGKVLVSTVSACSWADPPTLRACPIQKYLAHTQKRDLGALCLGPAASAAEAEEERLVRCLSGCRSDVGSDPGGVSPERCQVDHRHNRNADKNSQSAARNQSMGDCLLDYPQILVQLLRGPFAKRFPDADLEGIQNRQRTATDTQTVARTDLCLWIGAFGIPRDDKRYRGGEDAWFFDAKRNSFGVADGVSEWEDLAGINPQEYAQDLMQGAQEEIARIQKERDEGGDAAGTTPADIAKEALTRSYHRASNFGSSTAIVGVLDGPTGVFGLANLGDSSSMILRRPRRKGVRGQLSVVKKVKEMQHGFNIPYQFAHLPSPDEWDVLLEKGLTRLVGIAKQELVQGDTTRIGDQPSAIQALNVPVQDGDLVLLGTDGFFDNVFDFEVLALTGLALSPLDAYTLFGDASLATPPEDVARALALAAYWRSLDKEAQTPFSKEARRCCHRQTLPVQMDEATGDGKGTEEASPAHALFLAGLLNGGKEDDITVSAAWVCSRDRCMYAADKKGPPPRTPQQQQKRQSAP